MFLYKSMKDNKKENENKQISISNENHRKLDIVRAKNQLKTFDNAIAYLLDFEYKAIKKQKI